jgi:hypothetical protein
MIYDGFIGDFVVGKFLKLSTIKILNDFQVNT